MNEQLNIRLGSSLMTFLGSSASLLPGVVVGFHWQPSYAYGLAIAVAAGIFAVMHELARCFVWSVLTAWWIGRRTAAFDRKA